MRLADGDDELRAAAFVFLNDLVFRTGGFVRRQDLRTFSFQGERVSLEQHMRGIRYLRGYPAISILTTYAEKAEDRPYEDDFGADGYPRYKWRGSDFDAPDNRALRLAMTDRKPLIWFWPVGEAIYDPVYPVWIVDEEPEQQQFVVAINDGLLGSWQREVFLSQPDMALRRQYAVRSVRQRLHQPQFRRKVLTAYRQSCAMCRLRHPELLDAAHIREDSQGGDPVITNGIAMCAIHHRAFDAHVVGIRPDYVIEVRTDILGEHDGPTLQHALQGMHGVELTLPKRQEAHPDVSLLEERFERFRSAI